MNIIERSSCVTLDGGTSVTLFLGTILLVVVVTLLCKLLGFNDQ